VAPKRFVKGMRKLMKYVLPSGMLILSVLSVWWTWLEPDL